MEELEVEGLSDDGWLFEDFSGDGDNEHMGARGR